MIGQSLPVLDLTKPEVQEISDVFDIDTAVIMCAGHQTAVGDNLEVLIVLNMASNVCRVLENPVKRFIFFSSPLSMGRIFIIRILPKRRRYVPRRIMGSLSIRQNGYMPKLSAVKRKFQVLRPPLIYGPGDLGKRTARIISGA